MLESREHSCPGSCSKYLDHLRYFTLTSHVDLNFALLSSRLLRLQLLSSTADFESIFHFHFEHPALQSLLSSKRIAFSCPLSTGATGPGMFDSEPGGD